MILIIIIIITSIIIIIIIITITMKGQVDSQPADLDLLSHH